MKRRTIVMPFKSAFLAIITAVFLGPIGLAYSTIIGSIVMLIITFIFAVLSVYTTMITVYVCWAVSLYWNVIATNNYNKRLFEQLHVELPDEDE